MINQFSKLTLIEKETLHNLNKFILEDNSYSCADITIHFRNIKQALIEFIDQSDILLGAVAWVTEKEVLEALIKKQSQLVIQKEDFLRPDLKQTLSEKERNLLQFLYGQFKFSYSTLHFSNDIFTLSKDDIYELEPIRAFGYLTQKLRYCTPKMHNKFLISASFDPQTKKVIPHKVWTGSANFTAMSMYSLENAITINHSAIAKHYMREYESIYALSDKLDWKTIWTSPFLMDKGD